MLIFHDRRLFFSNKNKIPLHEMDTSFRSSVACWVSFSVDSVSLVDGLFTQSDDGVTKFPTGKCWLYPPAFLVEWSFDLRLCGAVLSPVTNMSGSSRSSSSQSKAPYWTKNSSGTDVLCFSCELATVWRDPTIPVDSWCNYSSFPS